MQVMPGTDVRRDARSGDPDVQFEIGCMYHDGYGTRQDYPEAAKWYRVAAERGHAGGQFNLGLMHWLGVGAPHDCAEAVTWFRRAADQGDEKAQFALGLSYFHGQGVAQDFVTAYMWFDLAARSAADDVPRFVTTWAQFVASGDHEARTMRDHLAARMTGRQIAAAQRAARKSMKRMAAAT